MDDISPKALPLKPAYAFAIEHGLEKEVGEIRGMEVEWDLSYTSTLRRGYIVKLLQEKNLFPLFIEQHWPEGSSPWGERKFQFYLQVRSRYEDFLAGKGGGSGEAPETEEMEQQFVAEGDLRNVLAANLECIEPGLRLFQSAERTGLELVIDEGRIDILAVDRLGKFVVIELKLSRGRNRALGQVLYYMGWVDANLGKAPCRGMIIAREIPPDLALAVTRVSGISLFRYKLAVSVERIG